MSSTRVHTTSFIPSDDLSSSQMGRSSPSLEKRIEELTRDNLQLAADNTRLKHNITQLESSLASDDTSNAALELKIQQLQVEKKTLEQSLKYLSTHVDSQKMEPIEKDEPARAYSPKRKDPKAEELKLQLEEKQRELDESREELDILTQQLLTLKDALTGLDTCVDAKLEEESAQAQRQEALQIEHQRELQHLQRTIKDLEDQLHQPQHRSTTSTLSLSHDHKPAQAESLESEFRDSGEFDKMQQTIESLQLKLEALDAQLKAAHKELSAKKTDTAAQSTFLSQQQRIVELEMENRSHQEETSKLHSANSKLQLELKQLVASREPQAKRILELEQELSALRSALQSEISEKQRLEGLDQSDRLRAELDQREASLQASEITNGNLTEENRRLNEQIRGIRSSLELGETDETSETDKIKSLLEELKKSPEPFYIKIKNGIIAMLSMLIGIIVFPFKFIGRSVGLIKNKSTLD